MTLTSRLVKIMALACPGKCFRVFFSRKMGIFLGIQKSKKIFFREKAPQLIISRKRFFGLFAFLDSQTHK